jgi:hypothetical protein
MLLKRILYFFLPYIELTLTRTLWALHVRQEEIATFPLLFGLERDIGESLGFAAFHRDGRGS